VAAPCVSPASSTGSSELGFGRSIDLTGQDLVVGAGRYAGGFGRAFVFHRDGAGGRFQLTADLQEPNDVQRFDAYFGDTVQIDGDTLIVTRPDTSASTGDGSKSGKVYVYRRVRSGEGTWALEQVLHSPEADGTWDGFGTAAALAGDLVAVRGRDETWIFQRKGAPASSEAPLANSEGATGEQAFVDSSITDHNERSVGSLVYDRAAEVCDSEPAGPGFYHADEVETSMMLALAPEAVRMDKAVAEYPTFPPEFGREPMQLRSFNSTGVFGDPRPATAETGEKIIARVVAESARRIEAWRQAL